MCSCPSTTPRWAGVGHDAVVIISVYSVGLYYDVLLVAEEEE